MNYGEELSYWYLRLNGFFLIRRFVIHKSRTIRYSSDCDLLAVRPPHVHEEVGGNLHDWDPWLLELLDFNRTIGVICEAKTGRYQSGKIFKPEYLKYSIGRLGFVPIEEIDQTAQEMEETAVWNICDQYQICKLLIAEKCVSSDRFACRNLEDIEGFLKGRAQEYHEDKYRDRMFFDSALFQNIIKDVFRKRDIREAARQRVEPLRM